MKKSAMKLLVAVMVVLVVLAGCEPRRPQPQMNQGPVGLYCEDYDVEDQECEDGEFDDDDSSHKKNKKKKSSFLGFSVPKTNSYKSGTKSTTRSYTNSSRSSGSSSRSGRR